MAIDPSDLIDSHEIADLLGLASNRVVSEYRRRYDDFPEPIIAKGPGRSLLWRRQDIEAWQQSRS